MYPKAFVHPKQIDDGLACGARSAARLVGKRTVQSGNNLVVGDVPGGPIPSGEAFFPEGNPYLGQAVLAEPPCQTNVLPPDRRHQ